jgi:hypothetical protein
MITMTKKSDYLEGHSRRNNMVVDGIAESPHDTWTESEDKVRESISDKLKMDHRETEVKHAHRTGKPTTGPGERPIPIVVKFLRFKDKVAVGTLLTSVMAGSFSSLLLKSLEGIREPSLWVRSFNLVAHTRTHTN